MSTEWTIGALVGARARASHDRVAILDGRCVAISYGELANRVSRWHEMLAARALGARSRVGLCLPAGAQLAVGLLGVSSYAACAPLRPDSPAAELAREYTDLGLDLIITTGPRCAELRALGVPAISADPAPAPTGVPARAGETSHPVQDAPRSWDTALLLRTSGTTGSPKVVPLRHANLRTAAENVYRSLALTPDDRCLDIMPLWHVHGFVGGLLSSIAAGGSVVCTPPFAADEVPDLLRRTGATWYTAAPALHRAILDALVACPPVRHRLRFVRSASSRLPGTLAAQIERTLGVPVIEAYGMTEAAHQIASTALPPGERRPGSVGAATGVRIAILGPGCEPLPAGDEGEVAIRDGSVFDGYENDSTGGSPFVNGWFRTGDLGRLDADGYLFLTGRIREMINRGGETIAPREVDEALLEHPDVVDAVAFGVPHPRLGEVVAAAVVARPGSGLTESRCRRFARTRLAAAKVPARIALVAEVPRGRTGKPRYADLRRLVTEPRTVEPDPGTVEPDPGTGQAVWRLARIWADLLRIDRVDAAESLSELGSDSLLCTRAANRIAATFGVRVPMDELLVADTVAEQAALVGEYLAANTGEEP